MTKIYIDTNVFLDFYRSATDRMAIFQQLLERADCIVVPEQTVSEFRRNRAALLNRLAKSVVESAKANPHTTALVRELSGFKEWVAAWNAANQKAQAIATQLRSWANDESSDPVCVNFVNLYCAGMTMSTPEDAFAKAHQRKLLGEPPTSPDKYTIGDEIIWETLLDCCNDDLIVVARDRTFLENESTLRREFDIDGKRHLVAVTDSLSKALQLVGKPSQEITEAETEIKQEHAARESAACNCPQGPDPTGWTPNGRFLSVFCKRCHALLASMEDPDLE